MCEGIESGTYVVVNVADLDEACAVDVLTARASSAKARENRWRAIRAIWT